MWPVDQEVEHLCGGQYVCAGDTYCATNFITQELQFSAKVFDDTVLDRLLFFDDAIVG